MGTANNCEFSTNTDLSQASFLWLAGETLPKQFWGEVGPLEFVLDEAKKILDRKFLSGAHIASNALENMLGSGLPYPKKFAQVPGIEATELSEDNLKELANEVGGGSESKI